MSVEIDEEDQPTVIVNIDDPDAKPAIRKVIVLVGAAFGGLAELIRRVAREHPTVTAVATTALVTMAASTVGPDVFNGDPHNPPPIAIEQIVTLPVASQSAATVTATVTRTPHPSAAAPTQPSRSSEPPTLRTRLPSSEPTPARSVRTSTPVKTPAGKTSTPAPKASDDEPAAALPETMPTRQSPSDTPAPEPAASPNPPSQDPAPTVAAAGCGGIIHVDVDPLLDLCVLG